MNLVLRERTFHILILIVILALAFFLRFNFSLDLVDSDSFYHARMVQYLVEDNSLPKTDPLAYYQVEGGVPLIRSDFFWNITKILYNVINFGNPFDSHKLYLLMLVSPIIFGLISVLLFYLISSKLFGIRIGLISAFCSAILPSLIYRTSLGFFEDENIGIILMLFVFFFYLMFLREEKFSRKIIYSLGIGIFIGLLSLTWKAYILIPLVILAQTCIGQIIISLKKENLEKLTEYTKSSIGVLVFSFVGCVLVGQNLFYDFSYYFKTGGISLSAEFYFWFFIFAICFSTIISIFLNKICKKNRFPFSNLSVLALLYGVLIILFSVLFFILQKSFSSINMFISEEVPGINFLIEQNGLIVILILLFGLLLPTDVKNDSKNYLEKLFLFLLILASVLMASYQLKYMLIFGLTVPIVLAFLLDKILNFNYKIINVNFFKKRFTFGKVVQKRFWIILIAILLLTGLFYSVNVSKGIEPITKKLYGVKESAIWVRENTEDGAKIFFWWDAGHLITFFADRKVVCDNRNYFGKLSELNRSVAEFFLTSDVNKGLKIIDSYDSDYLIIYSTLFTQSRVLGAYYSNPKNALDSEVNKSYYGFCERLDNNIICDGKVLVDNRSNESDYWNSTPNAVIDGEEYHFYLTEDSYFLIEPELNSTNLAKIFFESEETRNYFEKVYSSKGVRIFRIKK